jgi:hypothetical protein
LDRRETRDIVSYALMFLVQALPAISQQQVFA